MGSIHLVTTVPGPRSREFLARKERAVPRAIGVGLPLVAARADGATVTDLDGNTFLDLAGGLGVLNVGHLHPAVVAAVQRQAGELLHTDFSLVAYAAYVELAEGLAKIFPGERPAKAAFFNSGAEAVENAVKVARYCTERPGVVAFRGAFHGRTALALSLTAKPQPYKEGLGPFVPQVYRLPYAYCYRCPYGLSQPACGVRCGDELEQALGQWIPADEVAAVVVEPVQGEGGFVVPPPEFLRKLRDTCDRHGILLVFDEVQTGFGRTGSVFAAETFGVRPDLMCLAKSLAAGLPLSAVVGPARILDALSPGALGGTFVGNPVACAAALEVLRLMRQEDLPAKARALGEIFLSGFQKLQESFPLLGDVRGVGAMVAMELVRGRETREPAREETGRLLQELLRRGVIAVGAGVQGNVLRVLAPLVMTAEQAQEALGVLEESLQVLS